MNIKRNQEWLIDKGLTVAGLARALGTNYQNVRRWINGDKPAVTWNKIIRDKFPDCPFTQELR